MINRSLDPLIPPERSQNEDGLVDLCVCIEQKQARQARIDGRKKKKAEAVRYNKVGRMFSAGGMERCGKAVNLWVKRAGGFGRGHR